ncbi:MAG TPA: hypothetical protein VGP43_12430 [Chitinophagaceae bacterium]|nr:hypothetical protein [Chitinophagaceae bacterium]
MKKVKSTFLFIVITTALAACSNRDENGSTDTSNSNSSKSITDSTRGDKPYDTSTLKTLDTLPKKEH